MFPSGILLCIVAIKVHYIVGQTVPHNLLFHCTNNTHDSGTVDIAIDTALTSSNSICEEEKKCGQIQQQRGSNSPVLKSCPKDQAISIVLTKSSSENTCGGEGAVYFRLYCLTGNNMKGVVGHVVNFILERKGDIGISTPAPNEEYELVDLTMGFCKDFEGHALDTSVAIGQILYVLIRGPRDVGLSVKNCTAYGVGSNAKVPLLNTSGGYTLENAGGVFLGQFTNYSNALDCTSKQCFIAQLHAFHFKDSMKVSLECSINVCANQQNDQCATVRRRKRRSNLQERVLRASMIVYNDLHETDFQGRSCARAVDVSLCLTMILAVILALIGYI